MSYTTETIYNEVYNQMNYYLENGSKNHIWSNTVDDFNDWICADYDLVKLALQAMYDFATKYNLNIPSTAYQQMLDCEIIFSK